MTTLPPAQPQPPGLVVMIASALFRHLLTTVAASLATWGVITGSEQTQFVTVALSALLWALGMGWSAWQKSQTRTTTVALATTNQTLFNEMTAQQPVSIP